MAALQWPARRARDHLNAAHRHHGRSPAVDLRRSGIGRVPREGALRCRKYAEACRFPSSSPGCGSEPINLCRFQYHPGRLSGGIQAMGDDELFWTGTTSETLLPVGGLMCAARPRLAEPGPPSHLQRRDGTAPQRRAGAVWHFRTQTSSRWGTDFTSQSWGISPVCSFVHGMYAWINGRGAPFGWSQWILCRSVSLALAVRQPFHSRCTTTIVPSSTANR